MKRKYKVVVFALVIGFAFAISAPMTLAKDLTKKDLVEQARSKITEISVEEAKAQLDKGGAIFMDCREPREYKQGHIPGAINIPRGLLEFKIAKVVPDKTTKIVMYCRSGGRASLACCSLEPMGYKNVVSIRGGWLAWTKAGYPVE